MRNNQPVTQKEYPFPEGRSLLSMTDCKGIIRLANAAFVETSGFSWDELDGQPHNLIRHPDMPAAAFHDMWQTLHDGLPWTGMVKNRRKNGDFYWVRANVTPVVRRGVITGYLSVRIEPTRAEVAEAQRLYQKINQGTSRYTMRQGW